MPTSASMTRPTRAPESFLQQRKVRGRQLAHFAVMAILVLQGAVAVAQWEGQMRSKSQAAWETAARCATLAQEASDPEEREHYARLRDAWTTLAQRCEPFNFPDVTEK